MGKYLGIFTIIATTIGSIWLFIKQLMVVTIRLNPNDSMKINTFLSTQKHHEFLLSHDFDSNEKNESKLFTKLVYIKGIFLHYASTERMLTAGYAGKEYVSEILIFRFQRKKFMEICSDATCKDTLGIADVSILEPWGSLFKIGEVTEQGIDSSIINLSTETYNKLDSDIYKCVVTGEHIKAGVILHGLPGNGKSTIIRHFASKYRLPINILVLEPGYTNKDLITMFSKIPSNSILLLEDFDSAFNKRKCIIGGSDFDNPDSGADVKFSFDTILNGLDGVYNNYKGVVFFMTANDIDKIDTAIKHRPSRIKYMVEVENPSSDLRSRILSPRQDWVEKTNGANLDTVCLVKEMLEAGSSEKFVENQLLSRI